MMPLRDSNCSGIRHSEKVSLLGLKRNAKKIHSVHSAANGTPKKASFVDKTIEQKSERAERHAAGRNEQVAHAEERCEELCLRNKLIA
jgi:hypothetical protein